MIRNVCHIYCFKCPKPQTISCSCGKNGWNNQKAITWNYETLTVTTRTEDTLNQTDFYSLKYFESGLFLMRIVFLMPGGCRRWCFCECVSTCFAVCLYQEEESETSDCHCSQHVCFWPSLVLEVFFLIFWWSTHFYPLIIIICSDAWFGAMFLDILMVKDQGFCCWGESTMSPQRVASPSKKGRTQWAQQMRSGKNIGVISAALNFVSKVKAKREGRLRMAENGWEQRKKEDPKLKRKNGRKRGGENRWKRQHLSLLLPVLPVALGPHRNLPHAGTVCQNAGPLPSEEWATVGMFSNSFHIFSHVFIAKTKLRTEWDKLMSLICTYIYIYIYTHHIHQQTHAQMSRFALNNAAGTTADTKHWPVAWPMPAAGISRPAHYGPVRSSDDFPADSLHFDEDMAWCNWFDLGWTTFGD